MKSRRSRVVVTRKPNKGTGLAIIRRMPTPPQDSAREHRISAEVVVDAYDGAERALGWYSYLEDRLEFPFTAKCVVHRAVSPLLVGDEVEVIAMAPTDECAYDMFVMIRWEHDGLGVPLLSAHTDLGWGGNERHRWRLALLGWAGLPVPLGTSLTRSLTGDGADALRRWVSWRRAPRLIANSLYRIRSLGRRSVAARPRKFDAGPN